jgi:hypothetical protein
MKWITRERPRIDRVASAWLIKKFVDPDAEFLFAPGDQVMARAEQEQATPFHVPASELGQKGSRTGFDAIVEKYDITDPAVKALADVIRQADKTKDGPESAGINAIVHGFFLMHLPDQQVLDLEMPIYEALYRYCRQRVSAQP